MFSHSKNWSVVRVVLLVLTLVPVVAFGLVVGNLAWSSYQALIQAGAANLFSTKISTIYSGSYVPGQFGLLPAVVGSIQVVFVALIIAFPISLAMAIAATEFSIAGLGRLIELLLSVFSGIPPVLYAFLSLFVVKSFILPKLTAVDLTDSLIQTLPGLPPWSAGMLPIEQSTILGGIFLALLIIPFMAPLILDSIRNVPTEQKEASLALGANRWYTLSKVILPGAMPGIITALTLGILKASGDVVISSWTIGFVHDGLPNPIWDIFERNATLTSTGAGLIGGFFGAGASAGLNFNVASFAALLLLFFAFVMQGTAGVLRKWLNRRYAA
jgi:ABC-type phosphate transport system permease subunit